MSPATTRRTRPQTLEQLLTEIRACTHCTAVLPCGPRPVLQAHRSARLLIIGQAPGRKVHESGIPWSDKSGERLRDWLGLTLAQFHDATQVAIMPMGFCYPGKAASGDMPPRPECAPRWHEKLNVQLTDVSLTLLIGRHAQAYYLGERCKPTLGETVRAWKTYLPMGYFPLPHPSPRNQIWLARNGWFGEEVVPAVREAVDSLRIGRNL